MKNVFTILGILLIIFHNCYSQATSDEIIFHSNGNKFSPLIKVEGNAIVLWTFDDGTTSSSVTPIKDYGTEKLRINRLRINPWNAVREINIGYDASDGGSDSIPLLASQRISRVENLNLVAPTLELWCSSLNPLDSLNFDNFINLKSIECKNSLRMQKISLKNTPNLKRICLEDNDLKTLDLSECTSLEDLRASINDYKDLFFSNSTDEMWHLCVRDIPEMENRLLYSHMENFPAIKELLIWNTNQIGTFEMHKSTAEEMLIYAYDNNYTVLDFSGALQNRDNDWADIDFHGNQLVSVNIPGCYQIYHLNLRNNKLVPDSVDKVLYQLDKLVPVNYTEYRSVDLRENSVPTAAGLLHKANLEARGWTVYTDTANITSAENFSSGKFVYDLLQNFPNPFNPTTVIRFTVPKPENVVITIYDIIGNELGTVLNDYMQAGIHEYEFNAKGFSSGIYFYKINAGTYSSIKKMQLLK